MNLEQITETILQMTVSSEYSLENREDEKNAIRQKIQKRLMLLPGIDQKSEERIERRCPGCPLNDPECCQKRLSMIVEKHLEKFETRQGQDFEKIMDLIEKNYHEQEI